MFAAFAVIKEQSWNAGAPQSWRGINFVRELLIALLFTSFSWMVFNTHFSWCSSQIGTEWVEKHHETISNPSAESTEQWNEVLYLTFIWDKHKQESFASQGVLSRLNSKAAPVCVCVCSPAVLFVTRAGQRLLCAPTLLQGQSWGWTNTNSHPSATLQGSVPSAWHGQLPVEQPQPRIPPVAPNSCFYLQNRGSVRYCSHS